MFAGRRNDSAAGFLSGGAGSEPFLLPEVFTVTNLPTMEFSGISERLYLIEKIGRGERI